MQKKSLLLTLLVIPAIFLSGCAAQQPVQAQTVDAASISTGLIAEGTVLPLRTVELGFYPAGGMVVKVEKMAGDAVSAGDVIASLALTPQQEAAITAAEQELVLAQNALQTFMDEATVNKNQAAYDLALAREKFNDASDKKRDKQHTYKYSKTRESKIELEKALTNYDLTESQVALAEQEVAKWENGPDQARLAELQARVSNAEAQLASVKAAAGSQLNISAPWSGTVVTNDLVLGQIVTAGVSYAKLADDSAWIVETGDLKETDLSSVKVGGNAVVTVDALPGKEFPAEIKSIEGIGVDKNGDITYKVTLSIPADPELKWNMTANVLFAQ